MVVILDPVGNVPVFLALTAGYSSRRRRLSALQASAVATAVILAFAFFGQRLLSVLGISLEALQVSGGMLLVLVALELLRPAGEEAGLSAPTGNPALVPLGTPLVAGPGAIAATMVYTRQAHAALQLSGVILALAGALLVVYLALRSAVAISVILSDNAIHLLSRLVGLLLAAIAVQLVASGVQSWVQHGVH
jgi:multiple antibiotic resistance protein